MSQPVTVDFDEPHLASAVERLPPDAVDALDFGAIRLDREGRVTFFSKAEGQLSGYRAQDAMSRHFFTEIAPCMDNPQFRGRIEKAAAAGRLDVEFGWVGDFSDRQRELRVRAQSVADGGCWIFIQRLE